MEDLQGARRLGNRGGTKPGVDVGDPTFRGWWSVPFASLEDGSSSWVERKRKASLYCRMKFPLDTDPGS